MTNIALSSIDKYNDVAAKNAYNTFFLRDSVERRLERIHVSTRDSARTPVQWTDGPNAGFTTGKPWFYVNPNYSFINAQAEERDPLSILNFYRRCLALRKKSDTLLWGTYREYFRARKKIFMYERKHKGNRILVICSFFTEKTGYCLPRGYSWGGAKLLLDNYISEKDMADRAETAKERTGGGSGPRKKEGPGTKGQLEPYEVQVWEFRTRQG